MAGERPRVVIVVLNFREPHFTVNCVKSLGQLTYPNYEIVIVDNNSGDDSVETFRRELPQTTLIESSENRGYCGGNNVGIRYALEKGAAYVNILNPDTLLADGDYLTRLVDHMESHPDVGAAGPKVFWHERGVVQNTILYFPSLARRMRSALPGVLGLHHVPSNDETREVEAINGVCVLAKRELFQAIGLFDEQLFMYCDELELGWRAKQAGWKLVYLPAESVIHLERPGRDPLGNGSFLMRRNSLYVTRKMGKVKEAWLFAALSLALLALKAAIASVRLNRGKAHWAYWWRLCRAYSAVLIRNHMECPTAPAGNILDQKVI
jgi:GT2 family glycosyltransferase